MATKTTEILDRLSTHLGDASDYVIAKKLGVTRATVSRWRTGIGSMSDDTAIAAAKLLGEDEGFLLLSIAAERATSSGARSLYRQLAGKIKGAAVITLAIGASFIGVSAPNPADATTPARYIM